MTAQTAPKRREKRPARVRPVCPLCGPGFDCFRARDTLGRAIRTRPRVYCCDNCAGLFAAR